MLTYKAFLKIFTSPGTSITGEAAAAWNSAGKTELNQVFDNILLSLLLLRTGLQCFASQV